MTATEPALIDDVIPPTVGVTITSRSLFYEPDGEIPIPKGGLFLTADDHPDETTGEMTVRYHLVGVHHGHPNWLTVDQGDVDWSCYTGLPRRDVVRSAIQAVFKDAARRKDTSRHVYTAALLQRVLS